MARPTKYNQTIQERADEYVKTGWVEQGDTVPSVVGLAIYLGVSKPILYAWAEKTESFLATLENVKSAQEHKTINGSLRNELNPTISKLILANHGYSEKQEQVISGGDKPVKIDSTFNILPVKPKDA